MGRVPASVWRVNMQDGLGEYSDDDWMIYIWTNSLSMYVRSDELLSLHVK